MAYLEWSKAYTARVRHSHVLSLAKRARELGDRLAEELDLGLLPFLRMGYVETLKRDMPALVDQARKYKHMLLLGIGGSALGARAMQKAFAPDQDLPGHGGEDGKELWIADNVCPVTLGNWFVELDPEQTVVVTISKSGGTIETISQYFLAKTWLKKSLGDAWKDHMIVITDQDGVTWRADADTEVTPYLTRNIVTLADIHEGTRLVVSQGSDTSTSGSPEAGEADAYAAKLLVFAE